MRMGHGAVLCLLVLSIAGPAGAQVIGYEAEKLPVWDHDGAPARRATHVLRVRIYADQSRRVLNWKRGFSKTLSTVNAIMTNRFDIRLAVDSYGDWDRKAPPDRLLAARQELMALDDGQGADLVIGLAAILTGDRTHAIASVQPGAKYVVLRGLQPARVHAIGDNVTRAQTNYRKARVEHTSVWSLLYCIGTSLGAVSRSSDGPDVMRHMYGPDIRAFSEPNRRVIQAAVDAHPQGRKAMLTAIRAALQRLPDRGFVAGARTKIIAQVDQRLLMGGDKEGAEKLDKAKDALRTARDLAKSDPKQSLEILRAVSRGLEELHPDPTLWLVVASGFADVGALTYADLALWHAGHTVKPRSKELRAFIQSRRRFLGIPTGKKLVQPAEEPRYTREFNAAYELLYVTGSKVTDLKVQLAKLALRYGPSTPGVLYLRCALAFRQGQLRGAKHCKAAVKADPEFWPPLSLLARAAKATRNFKKSRKLYRQVIKLAPHQREPWLELMKLLKNVPEALKNVEKRYNKRFPDAGR